MLYQIIKLIDFQCRFTFCINILPYTVYNVQIKRRPARGGIFTRRIIYPPLEIKPLPRATGVNTLEEIKQPLRMV